MKFCPEGGNARHFKEKKKLYVLFEFFYPTCSPSTLIYHVTLAQPEKDC